MISILGFVKGEGEKFWWRGGDEWSGVKDLYLAVGKTYLPIFGSGNQFKEILSKKLPHYQ